MNAYLSTGKMAAHLGYSYDWLRKNKHRFTKGVHYEQAPGAHPRWNVEAMEKWLKGEPVLDPQAAKILETVLL